MFLKHSFILLFVLASCIVFGQTFERFPSNVVLGGAKLTFKNIQITSRGSLLGTTSMGLLEIDGTKMTLAFASGQPLTDDKGHVETNKNRLPKIFKDVYEDHIAIKYLSEGPGEIIYVVSENNNFGWMDYTRGLGLGEPPFNFPGKRKLNIRNIWLDPDGDLFIAAASDTIYLIKEATKIFEKKRDTKPKLTFKGNKDSITEGAKTIAEFVLERGVIPYSFAFDSLENEIWIGTNKGIYRYDKQTGQKMPVVVPENGQSLTVTHIELHKRSTTVWFSTLENGMGNYNSFTKSVRFFPYKKKGGKGSANPVQTFCKKSSSTFFVAPLDSLPAVFDTETGDYKFINSSIFKESKNNTTDIKVDARGYLYLIKGGDFFYSKDFLKTATGIFPKNVLTGPYITDIMFQGRSYRDKKMFYERFESLQQIELQHDENNFDVIYSGRGFNPDDTVVFAWKMDGYTEDWVINPFSIMEERMNTVNFVNLKPGTYVFRLKVKRGTGDWMKEQVALTLVIAAPFWQTWWFWLFISSSAGLLFYFVNRWSINRVRKRERLKAQHEKSLLELEAKALRAQMNPHFIFNSMNSIKALMQQGENKNAISYLTTFSKLIRTIFNHSDKRQVTLFDELETCKLYLQLESLRFGNKLQYEFNVAETIDLKSIEIPALIIQPFIENAVWHGIMPKDEGGKITVTIKRDAENMICTIDDNGIGRAVSAQNKAQVSHESKGLHLTRSRLNLEYFLNEQTARINIIDKTGPDGASTGTLVEITLQAFI